MSVTSVIDRLDELVVQTEIADLAKLANGLLEKAPKGEIAAGHRRYPHLVPMYRTVHRTKPRPMVLRAIRWVNPKRMMPGAGLTREEMEKMSKEELSDLIVKLNDYRGEAHVIHNRYNQMIDMIDAGQLPYYIPYIGVNKDKWMSLQDHMDRAVRLKEGTKNWESALDHQALEIREILNKKHDTKLDDIDGLWVDAKGNPAAPNFLDVKQAQEAKKFLRVQRLSPDGTRLLLAPKIYARRFIAVPQAEIRAGESVRMPAGGQLRRPRDPRARAWFDEHGGAAAHLMRVPRGFGGGTEDPRLRQRGQLISFPAGRENPNILTFGEVSDSDVANRREERWTHRGLAPHRGAASRGRQGSIPQEGPAPHGREDLGERGEQIRPRSRQRDGRGMADIEQGIRRVQRQRAQQRQGAGQGADLGVVRPEAIAANEAFNKAAANVFAANGINTSELDAMRAIKEDDIDQIFPLGGGVNRSATYQMRLHDGRRFVFKVVVNEQKAELFANVIDNILDLNTQAPTVIAPGMDVISNAFIADQGIALRNFAEARHQGGGHLQKFCEPNCKEWSRLDSNRRRELAANENFRNEYHRNVLLDFIGGNWDRHGSNFMVSEDGHFVGIDNGFHIDVARILKPQFSKSEIENRGTMFSIAHKGINQGGRSPLKGYGPAGLDIDEELGSVFDRHFDLGKINDVQREFGMANRMEGRDHDYIKAEFIAAARKLWR